MPGIIFEGADASGKSTLARKLSRDSGRDLFLAGGKPNDDKQMWEMIGDQRLALQGSKLVDRVSTISQQVYREGLFFRDDLMAEVRNLIDDGHVLVYCRPPDHVMLDPRNHEWKSYDTDEWKQNILKNQKTYMDRYDMLMARLPCVIYDWTSEESRHIEQLLASLHIDGIVVALSDIVRKPTT